MQKMSREKTRMPVNNNKEFCASKFKVCYFLKCFKEIDANLAAPSVFFLNDAKK